MSVEVVLTPAFCKAAKPLIKKYKSLKKELQDLERELNSNPCLGTLIADNVYKIRLRVRSKGRGKSGGLRVISYVSTIDELSNSTTVYLLFLYDKAKCQAITLKHLRRLVRDLLSEYDC